MEICAHGWAFLRVQNEKWSCIGYNIHHHGGGDTGQLRTTLDKSGQFWITTGQLQTTPHNTGQIWTITDNYGQLWITPDNSRQLRTTLEIPKNTGQVQTTQKLPSLLNKST